MNKWLSDQITLGETAYHVSSWKYAKHIDTISLKGSGKEIFVTLYLVPTLVLGTVWKIIF